jgi:hypothetical protein
MLVIVLIGVIGLAVVIETAIFVVCFHPHDRLRRQQEK